MIEPGTFPTAKVTGGYDFVGDDYDPGSDTPANTIPQPDPDPLDCNGHGSHVSGTAAGAGVAADGTHLQGPVQQGDPEQDLRRGARRGPGGHPEGLPGLRLRREHAEQHRDRRHRPRGLRRRRRDQHVPRQSAFGTRTTSSRRRSRSDRGRRAGRHLDGQRGAGAYVAGSPGTLNESLAVAAVDSELAGFPAVAISGAVTSAGLVANGADGRPARSPVSSSTSVSAATPPTTPGPAARSPCPPAGCAIASPAPSSASRPGRWP